ncbi:MAG: hypothetical protein K2M98_07170 [Muribaculum sp.]|nr:hypothetical protein [Muribaculum sp.]
MKKLFWAVFLLLGYAFNAHSEEAKAPFEGELQLTTFINLCDYINNSGMMAGGNGIHYQTLVLKGDKGKLIDKTTGATTVWDLSKGEYVTFIDELKKGLSYENNLDAILMLAPRDTKIYGKYLQKLLSNTIAVTGTAQNIDGHDCVEMKGTIVREQGGMESKFGIKVFCDSAIAVPSGYAAAIYGLEVPGLPMKWTYQYDGGHVPVAGELSVYMETTVTDIQPRSVDDSEFARPTTQKPRRGETPDPNVLSGYKMTKTTSPMSMMGYFKAANKFAKEKIAADKASGNQDGYDSFQTSGEWDF